jgi:putative flippase GtrA
MPDLVRTLLNSATVLAVVVVDDGSGEEFSPIFSRIREEGAHVLRHFVNLGKGAALKTGLNFAACSFPRAVGVVTADADGQHAVEDILATGQRLREKPLHLILGAREFGTGVPLRSRIGNVVTREVMHVFVGAKLSDTQTGLRGIPRAFIPELLRLKTTGYDFELDMLLRCRKDNRTISEIGIRTIYLDGNRASHFNPLLDSMRVYFVFLRFASVSLLTTLIDNIVFAAAFSFWPKLSVCQAISRSIAGLFNYFANKREVFHSHASNRLAVPKYVLILIVSGVISYLAINGLVSALHFNIFAAKLAVETALFLFSFIVQRAFVFSSDREEKD